MTAVVSVPWAMTREAGFVLGDGHPLQTKEAPEVGRVYFLVPVHTTFDRSTFMNSDDVEVQYFWSSEEAKAWSDADVERRLDEDLVGAE